MKRNLLIASLVAATISAGAAAPVMAGERVGERVGERADDLRDKRYCEIFLGYSYAAKLNLNIFNTIGYNYCPEKKLKSLNLKSVAKQNAADTAELNGPRHWVLDAIDGGDVSGSGETKNLGGIEMTKVGTFSVPLIEAAKGGARPYLPQKVNRTTIWIYDAGKAVFEMVDDRKQVYIMQSYSQEVDPSLKMADLPTLGSKLKLPPGWAYRTRILTETLNLNSNGQATITQDDLKNTYQKM
jgi:hypothetical protein